MNRVILAALAALCLASGAGAAYPEKTIRLVIPSAAGGSPDVLMRILAQQLSSQLGVAVVIENKPGASFVIGTMEVVRAPPDGYTLGYGNIVSLAINRSLLASVPYDIEKDLTLISNCVRVFNLLAVNKNLPVNSVQELVAYAKKHPGKLVMASGGNGTTGHLGGELFKTMTGTYILHVPYRGSPQAINDLIAGEANMMFDNLSSITPHVKAGRVRGLAVSGPTPLAGVPGPAGDRRARARLRDGRVGRRDRAGEHAARRRRQAERRDQEGARLARGAGALQAARHRDRRRLARGIPRARQARDGQVGGRRQALGREGRLK